MRPLNDSRMNSRGLSLKKMKFLAAHSPWNYLTASQQPGATLQGGRQVVPGRSDIIVK
jgi:hypothetical protein